MFKIGWAEESILPENKKVFLAGQFFKRISEYVETPISVTAMAIETEEDAAVFCTCDLVSTSHALLEEVRAALCGKTDLPLEKIIISATHTHTSMQYKSRSDYGNDTLGVLARYVSGGNKEAESERDASILSPEDAMPFLIDKISSCILRAWNERKAAMYATGFGRAAVGMCRRTCYDDGSAKMWGDTNSPNFTALEAGNDSGIELLFMFDASKKLTGVVANIACPSQVVEHRSFVSADYWGKVKILLREKFGENVFLLPLCAAAGDQCPRDMIRWVNPETPIDDPNIHREDYIERDADPSMFEIKGTWLVGKRIVNEILWAYDEITEYKAESPFCHKVLTVDLPVRRVTPLEYEAAKKEIESFVKDKTDAVDFRDNAKMHIHAGTMVRYELQKTKDIHSIEVHVLRLGDIAIATNPFELFLDYGNQIRARSRARQTFLVQLSCGASGYLPTEKAEKGSHYSAYVSSGITGHAGGEMLVRKTLEIIRDLWEKEK